MIVLSRRHNESIVIASDNDEEILLTVIDMQPRYIKLGLSSPPNFKILRRELYQRIYEMEFELRKTNKENILVVPK